MVVLLDPTEVDDVAEQAAAALGRGELVAFPTETVYGLGADASSATAVDRIFEAKGRPRGHPLIVHVADTTTIAALGCDLGSDGQALAEAFWPGPLTLIVERGPGIVAEATGGLDSVGLRIPDHGLTLCLLARFGGGVAGPSANRFGSVSPTTARHVLDDLGPTIDYVVDGGPCRVGVESTIVDLTGSEPTLLRPGGISAVEIEAVLGRPVADGRRGPARASGMLASHYAPEVPADLVEADRVATTIERLADQGLRVGLIAPFERPDVVSWCLPAEAAGYATRLYSALREADGAGLDRLILVPPTGGSLRDAVLDRLAKAAAPRPVGPRRLQT